MWPLLSRLQTIAGAAAYAAPHDVTSDPDEDAIDDLFRGPPKAFIDARNALAERLCVQGKSATAQRVRALRKPSVSAWAVNQLWWFHREAYDALHAAGAALAELQRTGASVAGQPANEARRAAIDGLRHRAAELLTNAGHAPSKSTLRRVVQSLEASAAGGSFGPDAQLGRLMTELSPPGFGQVACFAPPPPPPGEAVNDSSGPATRSAALLEHARTTRALEDATVVLHAAQGSCAEAEATLRRAERTLAEARAVLERAEARHEAAATAEAAARDRLRREEP